MIKLQEIIEKCNQLKVSETRLSTDEYYEIVVYNEEIEAWNGIFVSILGQPEKPEGVAPSAELSKLVYDFGGIHKNQVLFKKDFENATVVAMFWPWQDKVHTTLKIILFKK